jgi:hypothetical protein
VFAIQRTLDRSDPGVAAFGKLVGIHRRSVVRVSQEFLLSKQTRLAVRL